MGCIVIGPDDQPARANADPLARLLGKQTECPHDVVALRAALAREGARSAVAMVDNRGFHSAEGSFSLFEVVTGPVAGHDTTAGELFFGHFVTPRGPELVLEKEPTANALMVELIAWDAAKGMYNFYEVIGDGVRGRWHYRGDSRDIADDIAALHIRRNHSSAPVFGGRLRCSRCHLNGGPILKELDAPHNDWWTEARRLPFAGRRPDAEVTEVLASIADAGALASAVHAGVDRLAQSPRHASTLAMRPLPEQIRPLFCPQELNLASDPAPATPHAPPVVIPTGFLLDPRLAGGAPAAPITVPRASYEAALVALQMRFGATGRRDADHAWLAPVKAASDVRRVQMLVDAGLVDDELIADVLAVDMTNPALSQARCGLLRFVPLSAAPGWKGDLARLLAASNDPAARELHANLVDPARNAASHRARARAFLAACRAKSADPAHVNALVRLLAQRRMEIAASDISPILEPGFREIFPRVGEAVSAAPGRLRLDEQCDVVP